VGRRAGLEAMGREMSCLYRESNPGCPAHCCTEGSIPALVVVSVHCLFLYKNLKETDHLECLGVDVRITLNNF
jgi:hypothetical protein